jgi:hypothetical protein
VPNPNLAFYARLGWGLSQSQPRLQSPNSAPRNFQQSGVVEHSLDVTPLSTDNQEIYERYCRLLSVLLGVHCEVYPTYVDSSHRYLLTAGGTLRNYGICRLLWAVFIAAAIQWVWFPLAAIRRGRGITWDYLAFLIIWNGPYTIIGWDPPEPVLIVLNQVLYSALFWLLLTSIAWFRSKRYSNAR